MSRICMSRQSWLLLVLWMVASAGFCPVACSGQEQPESAEPLVAAEEQAFRNAVQSVAGSVVQIETFGGLERVGQELAAEGPTTGTIVGADGWIISSLFNFRQQPASILVTLPDGQRVPARIAARDFSRELALLKVEAPEPLPELPWDPESQPAVGEWSIALGKTYDRHQVSQSVGIVSGLDRAYGKALQTDAKISPINYGGPLIDLYGQVIGILSPISPGTFLEGDSSQLYDSGIGFAIPIADVMQRLPTLQAGQDIRSGKLGIVTANQNELVGPVRISGAAPGSPAAKSALRAGDTIVAAGGRPVTLLAHLRHALGPVDAGQSLEVVVDRDGQQITVRPELVDEIPVYRRRYLGLRLSADPSGVKITGIEPDSPAARGGLAVGQTIVRCGGLPVEKISDLTSQMAVLELDQPLQLEIVAGQESPQAVALQAVVWPDSLPGELPTIAAEVEDDMTTEVVPVVLGDFPNKSYAVIPPLAESRSLGLLIVYPEPGELDQQATQSYWSSFCRDYGWIVAVINSGNPRTWSREEIELAGRVIGRLDNNYDIDPRRTVIAGLGIGGRIALAAAASELPRVSGVATIGTTLPRLGWPQPNAPLQSVDFLLVGPAEPLADVAQELTDLGYAVHVEGADNLALDRWESFPGQPIRLWLEGLGRF